MKVGNTSLQCNCGSCSQQHRCPDSRIMHNVVAPLSFVGCNEEDRSEFRFPKQEEDWIGIPSKVAPLDLPPVVERSYRDDDNPLSVDDEIHLPRWVAKE